MVDETAEVCAEDLTTKDVLLYIIFWNIKVSHLLPARFSRHSAISEKYKIIKQTPNVRQRYLELGDV